jgi:hypothetical protein
VFLRASDDFDRERRDRNAVLLRDRLQLEVRDGLAKVVSLMDFRRAKQQRAEGNPAESGDGSGYAEEVPLDRG